MSPTDDSSIRFLATIPIFRIFSVDKAREFYVNWLGFQWDWTHEFEGGSPRFAQVSRGDLRLHLSEHHGDGSPGIHVNVTTHGVRALHADLQSRPYLFMRPGLQPMPWGLTLQVIDPFGNRITFIEPAIVS